MLTPSEREADMKKQREVWKEIDFPSIPVAERPDYLELAMHRFEWMYNHTYLGYRIKGWNMFSLRMGRIFAKLKHHENHALRTGDIVEYEEELPYTHGRIYAFMDIRLEIGGPDPYQNDRYGGLIKPGSWRAPEPKKYVRAHLFASNPMVGAGWYGPQYYSGKATPMNCSEAGLRNGTWVRLDTQDLEDEEVVA